MTSKSPKFESNFPELLALFACPACHGDLLIAENRVVCTNCERYFPIVDEIPVLIAEPAQL